MIGRCFVVIAPVLICSASSGGQTSTAASRPAAMYSIPELKPTQPSISIDVKNGTLADVAAGFYYATDRPCVAGKPSQGTLARAGNLYTLTWTLSAANRPFWEVFEELNRQHEIGFSFYSPPGAPDLVLIPLRPGRRTRIRAGDFMIDLGGALRAPRPDDPLFLSWGLVADPRLRIVRVTVPTLTMMDDRAEKLEASTQKIEAADGHGLCLWSFRSEMSEPPTRLGKYITSVKGEILVGIAGVSNDVMLRVDCGDTAIPMRQ